jgi:transposase InsO family protein
VSKARAEPLGKRNRQRGTHHRPAHHHHLIGLPATISRHLHAAEQPNERWQADFTHWWLADGTHVEILDWLDDHARYALSVTAHHRVTGATALAKFRKAVQQQGIPYSTPTDNGMVSTARLVGGKGGRTAFKARATTLSELQVQLDASTDDYNHRRPYRSHPHRATPVTIYAARPKPTQQPASTPTTASAPNASAKPDQSPCGRIPQRGKLGVSSG